MPGVGVVRPGLVGTAVVGDTAGMLVGEDSYGVVDAVGGDDRTVSYVFGDRSAGAPAPVTGT